MAHGSQEALGHIGLAAWRGPTTSAAAPTQTRNPTPTANPRKPTLTSPLPHCHHDKTLHIPSTVKSPS